MATYKVIQDIEAEDKLLGPLTLRQFIYAAVVVVMGFISFKLLPVSPLLILPFLPPMIFFGMLAAPFGHDQPSEVWMLAKIRFFLKPRRRIWNQDGVQELVTITVPKKVEKYLTNGLNQFEVKSRLQALASTLDSRGWAVKNVSVNLYSQPSYLTEGTAVSDRLVDVNSLPQEVPNYEVYATDDIMDERSNPTAQHLDTMINQSEQAHHQAVVQSIQSPVARPPAGQPPADYWFMNQPAQQPAMPSGYSTFSSNSLVFPGMNDDSSTTTTVQASPASEEEAKLLEQMHRQQTHKVQEYSHLKTVRPLGQEPPSQIAQGIGVTDNDKNQKPGQATPITQGAAAVNPTILRLANNDDLNVATLSREANKAAPRDDGEPFDSEVTISLR